MSTALTSPEKPRGDYSHITRPAPSPNTVGVCVVLGLLLIGGIWSLESLGVNLQAIINSLDNAVAFIDRMFPLDFPPAGEMAYLLAETFAIVFLATLLSVIISIPAAFFAARPTTTGSGMYWFSRSTIVLSRAIPDLILAIVFLRLFGIGPLAGILAMGIHSVGMVGKLYADAIEEFDQGPSEAIRAVGGTRMQRIHAATIIQLLPQIIATALHRFDINLRTSVLLGYVGVGGIGLAISNALSTLNYQRGMALAFTVLILCIVVELISATLRAAIMKGSTSKRRGLWSDKVIARITGAREQKAPAQVSDPRQQPLTPPWNADRVNRFLGFAVVIVLTAAALWQVEIRWGEFFLGIFEFPQTVGLFFPPETSDTVVETVIEEMIVTVQIALGATLLGLILAVPIGVLAARNVVSNRYIQGGFRALIVCIRGIPELILAIIFVVISGLGGVAGTLALAIGAVGLLSKLLADSLEETAPGPQEALTASGASGAQVFFSATLRQGLPAFIAHVMYLFDTNIRSATLLGLVGAGGVGFLLMNAARVNQFPVVTTILIVMLVVVLAVEAISVWMRKTIR